MNSNRKAQAKDAILMETALRRLKKNPDFIVDVASSAKLSVSVTSLVFIVVQSFQLMIYREKSSSTVDRYIQPHPAARQAIAQQMPRGDDFEVGEVGLPHLIDSCRFIPELIGRFHHDKGRT